MHPFEHFKEKLNHRDKKRNKQKQDEKREPTKVLKNAAFISKGDIQLIKNVHRHVDVNVFSCAENGTEHTWVGVCSISGHQTVRRITEALTAIPSPEDALPKECFAGRALGQVCNIWVSWEQHRRNTVSMDVRQT